MDNISNLPQIGQPSPYSFEDGEWIGPGSGYGSGFQNPYLTSEPTTLEDLSVVGTARYADWAKDKLGRGYGDMHYHPDFAFERSLADLAPHLSSDARMQMLEGLPSTMYDYSGLSTDLQKTLGQIFSGGEPGALFENWEELIDPIYAAFENVGDLERREWLLVDDISKWGSDTVMDAIPPEILSLGMEALPFTDVFTEQSIADTLNKMYGLSDADKLRAGEFVAWDPKQVAETEFNYYNPLIESERDVQTHKLSEALSKDVTGGFAASGGAGAAKDRAMLSYNAAMEAIIEGILKNMAGSTQELQSQAMDWMEKASAQTT